MEKLAGESSLRIDRAVVRDTSADESHTCAPKAVLLAHRVFEAWAHRTPPHIAVRCGDEQLTYAELNTRANQLARYLRGHGSGNETLVGICLHRSVQMTVAILAVLKAGAAYLPLDPTYPNERLSFILNDAKPKLLITQRDSLIRPSNSRTVELNREWPLIAKQFDEELEVSIAQDDLAYVIYTSGSTGQPKGVMITYGNLGHYAQSLGQSVVISASDVYLHTASISFSSSVRQLMLPLCAGAAVEVATTDQIKDPLTLFRLIKDRGVTVIDIVPSYFRGCIQALNELTTAEREELLTNRLRLIHTASEPLPFDTVRKWRMLGNAAQLLNMFGQTETTGIVATYRIPAALEHASAVMPLGRPIDNTSIYVLDDQLQPLPAGAIGEICVGGAGVGRGYLNRQELTAEKFIDDSFAEKPGARLYRTGDLGRVMSDGNLEFVGRVDNQIKIRGHRVEPGEIEALLRQHPSVRDAVVIARKDFNDQPRLVTYIVPERSSPSIAGCRRYRLPNGMAIAQQNQHETDFFYQQIFVDQTNFRHGITLCDDDCVFDVGANIGMFSLFAQQVSKGVKIFAFEPIPQIFEALAMNATLYGDGVKTFSYGLAEREQQTEFIFYPNSTSQSGRYADADDERKVLRSIIDNVQGNGAKNRAAAMDEMIQQRVDGIPVVCKLKTISQVMREEGVDRIDLLKIDVEKSELDVLRGIDRDDWPKVRQVVIEAHDVNGQLQQVMQLLRDHGFQVLAEQDNYLRGSNLYNVYASRVQLHTENGNDTPPFVVPVVAEATLTADELRRYVQENLPEYYWPAAFMVLEELPRLPNGKIDRQALPEPESDHNRDEFVHARTPVEKTLARIWAEVLKLDRVSVNDNFFDLGGDSIVSAQIIAKAHRAGLKISPKQIVERPTVAGLCELFPTAETPGLAPYEKLNQTAANYPRDSCIHELFEQQVGRTPNAVAVRCESQALTFAELNVRANRLAHRLKESGVGPESLVAIHIERSFELVVAVLGVLKAGGAYVPFDPAYPPALLSFMLADCQAGVLLTQQKFARAIDTAAELICLDDSLEQFDEESAENLPNTATPANLAYVMYTSGSTDKPKGIMVPHRALVNYVWWAVREYDVARGEGAPLLTSIAFDLTITSLFCPLLAGRAVILQPGSEGIELLSQTFFMAKNVSFFKITPTHLRALNHLLAEVPLAGRTRVLVIGGEALHAETIALWRKHAPETRIINEYGPTEATVGCCAYEVRPNDSEKGDVSIGRPIANTQLYVLDENLQPVQVGEVGELYIGGDVLARGYLNQPELTEAKFIRNPFKSESGSRLYKSGDLARLSADGNIEFLGRVDNQVKVRGYRVELGEIESSLCNYPNVLAAAVVCADGAETNRLVAHIVPRTHASDTAGFKDELLRFLESQLPAYALPATFVIRESLPVTVNGKLDRAALKQASEIVPHGRKNGAPRSSFERELTKIWADALKLDQVGIHDNFFDLGGNSIIGAQILARAIRAGFILTPKELFACQTIAELSAKVLDNNANSAREVGSNKRK